MSQKQRFVLKETPIKVKIADLARVVSEMGQVQKRPVKVKSPSRKSSLPRGTFTKCQSIVDFSIEDCSGRDV